MPDLIAQGPLPANRWRRRVTAGATQTIGRAAGPWSTPWDDRISRRHIEVVYREGRLHVQLLSSARNPVFYRGHKAEQFSLGPGDHFAIGQTTFTLVEEKVNVSLNLPQPLDERTFTLDELRRQPFRQADRRIDVLSRLPDIISGSANEQEMLVRLVNLLLSGIECASAAAVVAVGDRGQEPGAGSQGPATHSPLTTHHSPAPQSEIRNLKSEIVAVLHWDRRILSGTDFRPSERLIRQAVETRESVVFVWSTSGSKREREFTVSEGVDWAFCVPLQGQACTGWALYVTGGFAGDFSASHAPDAEALRDDVKFAELTAATLAALRESHLLSRRQASLSQFFSPVVLEALSSQDAIDVLTPREADVTVLFCDLRGFTQQSERYAGQLFDLLQRVSQALGVMTHHILEQGGVVGDYHGDSAMGFWGWPLPQVDAVERACRAALGIQAAFNEKIADFRVGIGIASGRAVAGKIGTVDQVKVTVFGPVPNLASRLEDMTKHLHASILIDPPTAAVIRASVPPSVARVRRLAKVRPLGLSAPLEVSELLPPLPLGEGGSRPGEGATDSRTVTLTDTHLAAYDAALEALHAHDWNLAVKLLHQVPPDDQAKDFLTVFIAQHNRTPPPDWDGTIPVDSR